MRSVVTINNIYDFIPEALPEELFTTVLRGGNFRVERIVSKGHSTPSDQWYDQELNERVLLLTGSAGLLFEDEDKPRELKPGDYLNIPAHRRHRIIWTDSTEYTVWLTIHYA